MKIIILIPYFGKWPPWMDYFLLSCRYNPETDFLFISDADRPEHCPSNVMYRHFSLAEFSQMASLRLGVQIAVSHPYKICDFRPAFGKIFSDYLKEADFWGYSDLDLIFGQIAQFLTPEVLDRHDIISVRREYLAGHFALFRNRNLINQLFLRSPVYLNVFKDTGRHYAFDERSNIYGRGLLHRHAHGKGNSDGPGSGNHPEYHAKIRLPLHGTLENTLNRIKYRMRINLPKHPADMNSIVNQAEESGEVRVFRRDLVRSDLWYAKNRIEDWQILWQGGKLSALPGVDELLHFHFISSKRNKEFHVEPLSGENGFTVTARGIRPVQ